MSESALLLQPVMCTCVVLPRVLRAASPLQRNVVLDVVLVAGMGRQRLYIVPVKGHLIRATASFSNKAGYCIVYRW